MSDFQQVNKLIQKSQKFKVKVKIKELNRIELIKYKIKIKNKMSMKRSLIKKTPEKNLKSSATRHSLHKNNSASQVSSNLYFCHFKNAMYMGGIKAFQRNGKGILLHDDGTNLISSYYNDLLHGHNVFFTNSCFLSAEYSKNKLIEGVYRTDGFMLVTFYNNQGQLDGNITLVNYMKKVITYCKFKKGLMTQKQDQVDYTVTNRVFELGEIDFMIGKKHARALSYNFQRQNNLTFQRVGNRLIMGYEKHSLMNGLAFSYNIGSASHQSFEMSKAPDCFQLALIQRGYYINGLLNGFGEKIFKNGNSYIGQFRYDVFQGNGILKNSVKRNWVSGMFQKGNLVDLVEYNHEGGDKKYNKIIQNLHQKRSNWINNQIHLVNWDFFDGEIQKIINTAPNTQVKTLEQRKSEVLKKIQENFICQNNAVTHGSTPLRQIQQYTGLKNTANSSNKQSVRKFVRNFIPKGQNSTVQKQIPRGRQKAQNKEMTSSRKNQRISQSIKSKVNIRKSRIFDSKAVSPSKSVDSFLKLQRVPASKQDGFSGFNKNRSSLDLAQGKRLDRSLLRVPQGAPSPRYSPRDNSNSLSFTGKSSPQRQLDSRRLIGKSRIFSYLNSEDDDIAPKFNYNQKQPPQSTKSRVQEQTY